jgi:hypothetical protein
MLNVNFIEVKDFMSFNISRSQKINTVKKPKLILAKPPDFTVNICVFTLFIQGQCQGITFISTGSPYLIVCKMGMKYKRSVLLYLGQRYMTSITQWH